MKKYFIFTSLLSMWLYTDAAHVAGNELRPILVPIQDVGCPPREYVTLQAVFSKLSTRRLNQLASLCVREHTWNNKRGLGALGHYMNAVENPDKYTIDDQSILYLREHQLIDSDDNLITQ